MRSHRAQCHVRIYKLISGTKVFPYSGPLQEKLTVDGPLGDIHGWEVYSDLMQCVIAGEQFPTPYHVGVGDTFTLSLSGVKDLFGGKI